MKNILLATTAIMVVTGGAAIAGDLPLKAARPADLYTAPMWTGGYIGAHVGAGRRNTSTSIISSSNNDFSGPNCTYGNSCVSTASGVVGGVQAGYDWQKRNFVYGIAADWSWTDLKSSRTTGNNSSSSATITLKSGVDWLASFRGRMGLAVEDTLVYVTGGVALGKVKHSVTFFNGDDETSNLANHSETKVGWVVGGGIEHRLGRNWSIKAEALYYDLGRSTSSIQNTVLGSTYTSEFHNEVIVGRVGVNYRF